MKVLMGGTLYFELTFLEVETFDQDEYERFKKTSRSCRGKKNFVDAHNAAVKKGKTWELDLDIDGAWYLLVCGTGAINQHLDIWSDNREDDPVAKRCLAYAPKFRDRYLPAFRELERGNQ